MQSDANFHVAPAQIQRRDGPLHIDCSIDCAVGIGKQEHHGIAKGFNQTTMMTGQQPLHCSRTGIDDFQCVNITMNTVKGSALNDFSEQTARSSIWLGHARALPTTGSGHSQRRRAAGTGYGTVNTKLIP